MPSPPPLPSSPWQPDRRWADPLIGVLALLVILMAWGNLHWRATHGSALDQVSLQGRVADLQMGARRLLPNGPSLPAPVSSPWDHAMMAIHLGEARDFEGAAPHLAQAPVEFLPLWERAYAAGPAPDPTPVKRGAVALGRTQAWGLLQARLQEADGQDATLLRQGATRRLMWRLAVLGGLGIMTLLAVTGGLAFGLFLAVARPRPQAPLPALGLGGRALAILFLSWFLFLQVSGQVLQIILAVLPFLRPWPLPLAYLLHTIFAVGLLCRMEGTTLGELWRRMTPGRLGPSLGWGAGYLGLTVVAVLAMAMVLSRLLPDQEPPQRELIELLGRADSATTLIPLFLTVAVLAPCLEELLFRGCLIPALARRLPLGAALVVGALAFGAMHLQPLGMPVLSLLGFTMGLAFARTGSLWSSILVHGCWNGAQFLLMRALY